MTWAIEGERGQQNLAFEFNLAKGRVRTNSWKIIKIFSIFFK